jgi:triosephosphate isomerase
MTFRQTQGKKIIVANWKMNPASADEAKRLFNAVKKTKAIICPPFVYLSIFKYEFLGAQDCHWEQSGAYTGEVSPKMLKDLGCKYVIIGHSERRALGETDEIIEKKLKAALNVGLKPILCIGEKKGEDFKKVINKQLKDLKGIIIAYEPIWAISTSGGEFCSPERAKRALEYIRIKTNNLVIYGGSVNSKTVKRYLDVGFDGALPGAASLDAKEFRIQKLMNMKDGE